MALQGGEIHGEEFGGSMGIEKGVIWIYKKKTGCNLQKWIEMKVYISI